LTKKSEFSVLRQIPGNMTSEIGTCEENRAFVCSLFFTLSVPFSIYTERIPTD